MGRGVPIPAFINRLREFSFNCHWTLKLRKEGDLLVTASSILALALFFNSCVGWLRAYNIMLGVNSAR